MIVCLLLKVNDFVLVTVWLYVYLLDLHQVTSGRLEESATQLSST